MTKYEFLTSLPANLKAAIVVQPHRPAGRQIRISTSDSHAAHAIELLARRAAKRVSTASSDPSENLFEIVASF